MNDGLKRFWQEVKDGKRPRPERNKDAPTKKLLRCNSSWAREGKIILVVYPHGELGFREPSHRAEYRIGIADAYHQAVVLTTNKIYARTRELRKQGLRLGKARRQARKELL